QSQIEKIEVEIRLIEQKIEQLLLQIQDLELKIGQKEKEIAHQKEILSELIRTIDRYDQESLIEIILKNDNFSEFLNQVEYTEILQGQVREALTTVKDLKTKLEKEQDELEIKKNASEDYKSQLGAQQQTLTASQVSRGVLLNRTRGQESAYQRMLQNIEVQKRSILGDINRLRQTKSKELARLQALQEKPTSGLASTSWHFYQTDARWAYTTIGFSNSLMTDYGCAVSAVAMVFKYYGLNIDPGRLAKQPIFYYDLIVWPERWESLDLASSKAHGYVDWNRIDREIRNGYPVIVFIRADGRQGGHYVVIHGIDETGRYVVHDPIWGPNIYLNSTRENIALLYNTTTTIDQVIIYH
ncbi:MAG TPA: hypothetical protein ENI16_00980, partial [Candidatus Portnoybacteria bacterium]|nr:hypothetical protein [Candidatus Portnoybacteria bacterium]